MFDIDLFRRYHTGEPIDNLRSIWPFVYNIETTNACPMRCKMCPRTTHMERIVSTMSLDFFETLVSQINPHSKTSWNRWVNWAMRFYNVNPKSQTENSFFLYVIPKVLQLHGYGEPLTDNLLPERIGILTEHQIPSYFSCNPSILTAVDLTQHMKAGLDYVKFSIESTDDKRFQAIRGAKANFSESFKVIKSLLKKRDSKGYNTTFIVTMLNLGEPDRQWEFQKLKDYFRNLDVFLYLKSEDSQWLHQNRKRKNESIHWNNRCLHPWMSMTILADGTIGACMETYDNNEFNLGNAHDSALATIWNSRAYEALRQAHQGKGTIPSKCKYRCEMKLQEGIR